MRIRAALLLASALGLSSLGGASTGWATTINLEPLLTNPSFEIGPIGLSCPTGWTCGGSPSPGAGSETVVAGQYTAGSDGLSGSLLTPYGSDAAILPAAPGTPPEPLGGDGSGSLLQTLATTSYMTGDTYNLDFWVGLPKTEEDGTTVVANYPDTVEIMLLANGVTSNLCDQNSATLVSLTGAASTQTDTNYLGAGKGAEPACEFNISNPGAGLWQEWQLTYTDTYTVTGNIGVEFNVYSSDAGQPKEINIDMGSDPVRVPEPATLGLFGAGLIALGLAGRRRRRARTA